MEFITSKHVHTSGHKQMFYPVGKQSTFVFSED